MRRHKTMKHPHPAFTACNYQKIDTRMSVCNASHRGDSRMRPLMRMQGLSSSGGEALRAEKNVLGALAKRALPGGFYVCRHQKGS